MKVVYQTCCGVDVHKSFLVATIIKTTSGVEPSYQKKRFSTFNNSIIQFKDWLIENNCRDICMESTGKYWIPVYNLLEDDINVTIANPKWVKAVKGNKDDTKDSKWIGDLFRLGLVPGSYIPCKEIRILREYTRYRYKLTSCKSGEKNRFQNALTVCNVALDSVVSDVFGKSATSIIDYLIEQSDNSINHEEISSRLLRSLKKKSDSVLGFCADGGCHDFAVLDYCQGGDAHDAEFLRQFRFFVDVDLYDFKYFLLFCCEIVYDRGKHPARAAPRGPEIHQNRPFRSDYLGVKVFIVYRCN